MKKFLIFAVLLAAGITYAYQKMAVADVVNYSYTKPHPKLSPLVEFYAGWYLIMKDRPAEAIPVFEKQLELWPEGAKKSDAIFYLGMAYENSGNRDRARELYEQYIADYPTGEHSNLAKRKIELFRSQ